jgi:catalase
MRLTSTSLFPVTFWQLLPVTKPDRITGNKELPVSDLQKPTKDRVRETRDRYRQAGFKRVEVYVRADQVDLVKAYAAELREHSDSEIRRQVSKLLDKAFSKYRASCLDNISIDPKTASLADAQVVAAALMHRGNAEAFKLGREIRGLIR